MYLRTGGRGFFDATESWVNYFMDLQTWRTDGWRWKDGGVWWHGGPIGNHPQRTADPVTGIHNGIPEGFGKIKTNLGEWGPRLCADMSFHFLAKACHCHNWGEGLAEWYMITGDRDAYEAAIDTVEQNYDTQIRAFGKAPGQAADFSRDFTRSCYLTNATRLIAPTDPFVVEASDKLAAVFLGRSNKEPRGVCKDWTSWVLPDDCRNGEGMLLDPDGKPVLDPKGQPTPVTISGYKESFTVTGVPASTECFVVVSFDDSSNRSGLSNQAEAK